MNNLSFAFAMYAVSVIAGCVIYAIETYVEERGTKHKLDDAKDALNQVRMFRETLEGMTEKLERHETKLSGLSLKAGWEAK